MPAKSGQNTRNAQKVKFIYQELARGRGVYHAQLAVMRSSIRSYWPKQETRLVVKMLKVIQGRAFKE